MLYLPLVMKGAAASGRLSPRLAAPADDYLRYEVRVAGNGFTWVGAIAPDAQVNLCVTGTVARTPWDSVNTARIAWNTEVISRSAAGSSLAPSPLIRLYLPIVMRNYPSSFRLYLPLVQK